ncbi:unnamed protein product [Rotaria sordida]|uniref:GH3 auxin-responsive promoter n=2 Tax=Rotaria sordida TaxID=392033 RepID=A0A814VDY0_9BILA|nr:unnamed protein product [Rotaria sordida]
MWLWTWFLNRCILLFQYLLIQYKGFRFNYDAKHAIEQKTNRKTLFNILKQNQNTKLLIEQRRKMNLDTIDTVENFKKLFPKYTIYSDYKPYIEQIKSDGSTKDIMSIGYPIALTNTSGTTGEPKNYPVYSFDINAMYNNCYMLTKSVPFNLFNGCKAISLTSLHYKTYITKDKLKTYKISAITSIVASEKQNIETILKFNQDIVPSIIHNKIIDSNDMFLFILLWALQCKELEVISSVFIMVLVNFFTFMENKFDFICKHIETGTIPTDESLSSPLPIDVRLALQSSEYRLKPNPSRAQELTEIVSKNGFHHISTRLWPNLKCGICILSQNLKQFELKFLSTYWDPVVPIFPFAYGMSEHYRIAVPLTTNSYQLIPLPRSVYYEFIEVENDDRDDDDDDQSPESLELGQIDEGKLYEVVLTTYNGLYRYRTEDIIKVTGYYYTLPVWKLVSRRGQYLSIITEHVTEMELREIIDLILLEYIEQFTSSAPQYAVFIDKPSYVLAIEVDDDKKENENQLKQVGKELCSKFDQKLQESIEEYKRCRANQNISSPILLWLKYNTLTTGTREYRLKKYKGTGGNQLKSQLIIHNRSKDIIKFIKENKVLETK